MHIGCNKHSTKGLSTKQSPTSRALATPQQTTVEETDDTTGPPQPLKLMDSSSTDAHGSPDQKPGSGAPSGANLTAPLVTTPRYGFLCFRKRSPRTV